MSLLKKINMLPDCKTLEKQAKIFAILDAILMPEWEYRFFSFDIRWNEKTNERMASIKNGTGDECYMLFSNHGVIGKVFSNGEKNNSEEILAKIPVFFQNFKNEPAFSTFNSTYCFWNKNEMKNWNAFPNKKSYPLLNFFSEGISYYHKWAENYYERDIDFASIEKVFDSMQITPQTLKVLNPKLDMDDIMDDIFCILGKNI